MSGFRIRRGTSEEEKVALRIKTIIEDLNLDIDQLGVMLARVLPQLTYTRLVETLESMVYEKEAIMNPEVMRQRWRDGL